MVQAGEGRPPAGSEFKVTSSPVPRPVTSLPCGFPVKTWPPYYEDLSGL